MKTEQEWFMEMKALYPRLFERAKEYNFTSSLNNPYPRSITYHKYDIKDLYTGFDKRMTNLCIILRDIDGGNFEIDSDGIIWSFVGHDPEFVFTLIHNGTLPYEDLFLHDFISSMADVHKSVQFVSGNKIVKAPDGGFVRMKHKGCVRIGRGTKVDAGTIIHRATFDSTVIGKNTTIFSLCNIGHNTKIGDDTIIGPGCLIAGSAEVGSGCKLWQGTIVNNKVKICDNVEIGSGSVVTRDITEPGLYFGSPCRKVK